MAFADRVPSVGPLATAHSCNAWQRFCLSLLVANVHAPFKSTPVRTTDLREALSRGRDCSWGFVYK